MDLHTTAMYRKLLEGNRDKLEEQRDLHDFGGCRDFLEKFLRQFKHFTQRKKTGCMTIQFT